MMRLLPSWYSKAEEDLRNIIIKIANQNNLNYKFVIDSQQINGCIERILDRLVVISEEAKPQFDIKELEDLKKVRKSLKDEAKKLNKYEKHYL